MPSTTGHTLDLWMVRPMPGAHSDTQHVLTSEGQGPALFRASDVFLKAAAKFPHTYTRSYVNLLASNSLIWWSPAGLAVSHDSQFLISISRDKSAKVFDVANFDMICMLRLSFVPSCAEWIYKVGPLVRNDSIRWASLFTSPHGAQMVTCMQ